MTKPLDDRQFASLYEIVVMRRLRLAAFNGNLVIRPLQNRPRYDRSVVR